MASVVVTVFCAVFHCASPYSLNLPGERELRPPRTGIEVGSLYYVRETPTEDISTPANLIPLCTVNLARYGVTPRSGQRVADIDLLGSIEVNGSLSGIQTQLVNAGLSGSISNYYEYKITNVTITEIEYVDAEKNVSERGMRNDCLRWQGNVGKENWGIYQIQSISSGDITFSRKSEWTLAGEVSGKLLKIEPQLKASIKRTTGLGFGGKGLVITFVPILRNSAQR
jgi:hypothetical protein